MVVLFCLYSVILMLMFPSSYESSVITGMAAVVKTPSDPVTSVEPDCGSGVSEESADPRAVSVLPAPSVADALPEPSPDVAALSVCALWTAETSAEYTRSITKVSSRK